MKAKTRHFPIIDFGGGVICPRLYMQKGGPYHVQAIDNFFYDGCFQLVNDNITVKRNCFPLPVPPKRHYKMVGVRRSLQCPQIRIRTDN